MTKQQAFAIHMISLISDMSNHVIGQLRSLSERTDSAAVDPVQGNMKSYLGSLINTLEKQRDRALADCREFIGTPEEVQAVVTEDFDSSFSLSANLWRDHE